MTGASVVRCALVAGLVGAVVLALAGCGGEGDSADATASTTTAAPVVVENLADACSQFIDLVIRNAQESASVATAADRYMQLAAAVRVVDASLADQIAATAAVVTLGEGVENANRVMTTCDDLGHSASDEQIAEIQELLVELHNRVDPTTTSPGASPTTTR